MTCCPHHEAYDERLAIMICEGMDEAQATQLTMLQYANRCYGCGRTDEPA